MEASVVAPENSSYCAGGLTSRRASAIGVCSPPLDTVEEGADAEAAAEAEAAAARGRHAARTLSMTKDAVALGGSLTLAGIDLAKRQANWSWGWTKTAVKGAVDYLHEQGHVEEGTPASSLLRGTETFLHRAHTVRSVTGSTLYVFSQASTTTTITTRFSV